MAISVVTTTIDPTAIFDLLDLPAHLRPGGECWPVCTVGASKTCARCGGTHELEVTDGGTVECPDCDSEGLRWYRKWTTSARAASIGRVDLQVGTEVWYRLVWPGMDFLTQDFKAEDIFATEAEALAVCEQRNAEASDA